MSSGSEAKYLILVPDGMADLPVPELGNITPLKAAKTPWMDRMAGAGIIGTTRTVPEGLSPGSDVANLSIMGYEPSTIYTGRAPFEAASMGVSLRETDLAFRLNLVTLDQNFTVMVDHSADHISSPEAHALIAAVAPAVEDLGLAVVPGVSYRNLLVWGNGPDGLITQAPHDIPGELLAGHLPSGPGADTLLRLIVKSWKILENHPVNLRRTKRCQGRANSVWPWGQGRPPKINTLTERFGISGAVVAAVDLLRGIGKYAGLEIIHVPGATGYLDTNYEGKVEAALRCLKDKDLAFLHVEAPDEAAHSGQHDLKIKAIEDFDDRVVRPVLQGLKAFPRWRILLMPDHPTPIVTRKHSPDPVPFILLDSEQWNSADKIGGRGFSEEEARASGRFVKAGSQMIEILLKRQSI
ncbi:MAG TPA: cofactor-independent phosphoglycerate mutase [Desulfomonilaceae bacterium]|nr:cofactor-independent phosphoglycerate mutase [Desulfomonilaceae bacterium]